VHLKQIYGIVLGALILFIGSVIPAQAASVPRPEQIAISHTAISKGYESSLMVQLDKPVSASIASQIKNSLERAFRTSRPGAGPTGREFLVCNKTHSFSDADGTFTIQHACGGPTGPWGYRISSGVCAFTISDVHESGMAWTRNGTRQGTQSPHPEEYCRYQFHGTFNPERDFDIISYSDNFTFDIEVGGQTGHADLDIRGSFYSARCTNPSACG
jgi:hypothetical protein